MVEFMSTVSDTSADTFNARHKSPIEVARDFIPPPEFKGLLDFNNCILVGPRGSGKTTLLKMLQVPALMSWYGSSLENNAPVESVNFIGVFVAADVRWAKQLEMVTKAISSEEQRTAIHESAFSNFVSLSLIEALQKSISLGVVRPYGLAVLELERTVESQLARRLSEIWKLEAVPSLAALKHSLRVHQAEIPRMSLAVSHGVSFDAKNFSFIKNSWLDLFILAVETINDSLGIEGQKWALLVDELEIVPQRLLERILSPLRSASSNVVFKFALSPTGAGSHILASYENSDPSQDNDFAPLRLGGGSKEDTRSFSSKLLIQTLVKKGLLPDGASLGMILGQSGMAEEDADSMPSGEAGRISLEQRKRIFYELRDKDTSFKQFLENKKIIIENLPTADKSAGGTLVRKITPLVYLRNHVLKEWKQNGFTYRSKISFQPYYRFPNILDLTEGNPRWVLNLAENLARASRAKGLSLDAQSVQTDAISAFKDRFISMLKVYPVGDSINQIQLTPYGFLKSLAEHTRQKIFENEFSPDPALSFVIDEPVAEKFGNLISICIHLGALVLVDNDVAKESAFIPGVASLEGRVVRVCYRLAPEFFLPLRAGRGVKMSSALSQRLLTKPLAPKKIETEDKSRKNRILNRVDQIDLF